VILAMLQGTETPCVVKGSTVEDTGVASSPNRQWVIKNDKDEIVGRFRWESVTGWWKGDE